MNYSPKVIDIVLKNDLCIGCGLCVYKCPNKAIQMDWDTSGFLVPKKTDNCDHSSFCIAVCPFNPDPDEEIKTENELAEIYLKESTSHHPMIGNYLGTYAGYANEFRLTSSSGGLATYILNELLSQHVVSHVFSVRESITPNRHYEYAISKSKDELRPSSQTKYYPVSLSNVFEKIQAIDGTVAIVGVACFIKAIRLAQHTDETLKNKIPFLVGIICGGVKSKFFAEYLASRAGANVDQYKNPAFRIKDFDSSAGDYSFGCNSGSDFKSIKMRDVGDMWGTGLFKANACNFCDDVTTELADISLGDAWIKPYHNDGKGTNVIITRSLMAERLIQEGIHSNKLHIESLSVSDLISSQQGSFNHRHKGLPYRIKRAQHEKKAIPPKRFTSGYVSIPFRVVQYLRIFVQRKSLKLWSKNPNSVSFDSKIKSDLNLLKKATWFYRYNNALRNKFLKIIAK